MKKKWVKNKFVLGVVLFLVGATAFPSINGNTIDVKGTVNHFEITVHTFANNSMLDMNFIYNISKALSDIIFDYNETAGEIAKGRAFGSKGEHKAAEILYDNMTKLGLFTIKEQIENIDNVQRPWDLKELTHGYEALAYNLMIENEDKNFSEIVECEISPVLNESEEHDRIDTYYFNGSKVRLMPITPWDWINAFIYDKTGEDYFFFRSMD